MTTDLVRYDSPGSSIELAGSAWPLAERIARTEFVPAALRGKPEAVLACILTGHELGIGAMQSLAKIHVIEGRPAMAAELMRAVILQHGHEFWIEETSNTRVTVGGMRAGSTRESRVTWTLDDAKRAGLESRQNWRKFPRAMLLARATAELARAMFADVLAGISYTVEELSDGEVIDDGDLWTAPVAAGSEPAAAPAAPAPAKKVAAKKAATRKAAPKAPPARGDVPPLPGEEEPERGVVDEPGEQEPEPGDSHVEREARPLTGPAAIAVALKEKGFEDREDKLRIVSQIIEREIESTKDLTPAEVSSVLEYVTAVDRDALELLAAPDADVVEENAGDGHEVSRARAADPPAPKVDDRAAGPDSWNEAAWRSFLADRGVRVTELLKEAQRLAREDGEQGPASLEQVVESSSSLKSLLVGWAEDLAAQRSGS
jgi:hypothetical protein